MPKQFIKKYLPDPKIIKENKSLKWFGRVLHNPHLWHLNRHSTAKAVAIGLFWCLIPMPFQMIPSAACAILVRANIPIAMVMVWVSNPLTMPPLFYFNYLVGTWILGVPERQFEMELSIRWITESATLLWKPLYLGSFVFGLFSMIVSYFVIHILWRWWVINQWKKRAKRRANKNS